MDDLTFNAPSAPVVQNAKAIAANDVDGLVASLKEHVYNPVQWTATVQRLQSDYGVTALIEAGPGKVLTGLAKRIDRALPCHAVDSDESLTAAIAAVVGEPA